VTGEVALSLIAADGVGWDSQLGRVVLAAVLGFVAAYGLERIKRRREPHRQLSWDGATLAALPDAVSELREKLEIHYQGTKIENLWEIHCLVENTGNRVVKDQHIRFKLPAGTHVLEAILDPEPEPEIGVHEERIEGAPQQHPQYRIAHLERKQSVGWRLIVTGPEAASWTPIPKNDEGDVDFVERGVQRALEDAEHVDPFFKILLLLVFLPSAIDAVSAGEAIDRFLSGAIQLLLLAMLAPHLAAVGRVLAAAARRWTSDTQDQGKIRIAGDNNVVAAARQSSVYVELQKAAPEDDLPEGRRTTRPDESAD
jgi:hypothetical protein